MGKVTKINYNDEKYQEAVKRIEDHYRLQFDELVKENEALKTAIENKDKLSNLRGWGVDRAINMLKTKENTVSFSDVQSLAEQLANFTYGEDYTVIKGDNNGI